MPGEYFALTTQSCELVQQLGGWCRTAVSREGAGVVGR